ncbi:hypothetical protein [Flavobacterium pectinovorum]|uniref:hypothetical protein n=1 Tax=Flavobacterium pectinovorum TaxID=29533 RepID=UPI001FACAF9E|nr:hypothetical protein [Flavobacterium pectinovorum]MCI9843631.1 hypothetical protein [Flavobacterium pectinovorum]
MKNFLLPMTALISLLISCTNENMDDAEILDTSYNYEQTSKLSDNLSPENPDNAFDIAGRIHNDILDAYLSGNYSDITAVGVAQKVDSIAALNIDFLNLDINLPINFTQIQAIIDAPEAQLQQEITTAPITNSAKICLSNFMDSLTVWEADEYAVTHQSIILWESSVINNPQFSQEEKRIMLTSSSIARYSLYYAKERKDKDWETSVGNRAGAVQGAVNNCSTAISRSIVTGLLLYNLQNQ